MNNVFNNELIEEIHKGILGWYPFRADSRIKKIQSEYDIQMLAGKKYDYIIVSSFFEKCQDIRHLFGQLRSNLLNTGHLLILMNNRLGIRYFCGDRDIYTERNFDGIEDYRRAYASQNDAFQGRMYDKNQMKRILNDVGFSQIQFYSVLSDLDNPSLIFAEDYIPNEDLANRVFPTYHYPDTVFLEEEILYQQMIDNGIFHQMANAYLVEATIEGKLSGINQVTSSIERGKKDAIYTISYKKGDVEKRAAYPEGVTRIHELYKHSEELKAHGIKVVNGNIENDSYIMKFVDAKLAQIYLKEILLTDKNLFLKEFDRFKNQIMQSSEIILSDDEHGTILKKAYFDMVPLNCFYMDENFVFFDQEFAIEQFPAEVIIYRMICTFFAGNSDLQRIISATELIRRYGLEKNLKKWQKLERDFMIKLRNERELSQYHEAIRRKLDIVHSNRQRMNYSSEEYQKLFVDIFDHADTRKLILFGAGNFARKFMMIYGNDYPVYAIIDNNKDNWGRKINGITIQSPDIIKALQSGEYKIIICIKNYLSVMKQLIAMGVGDYSIYDPGKNYSRPLKPIVHEAKDIIKKKYHIGYVAGVFDMFHIGHVNLLRKAKEQSDYLIVGVISDETVYRQKQKKPIIPFEDRCEVVKACRYVDQVEALPLEYNGIRDAYRMFHFDCQFSGDDHGNDANWQKEKAYLEKNGADIVFFPYTNKISSTKLREQLRGEENDN